MTPEETELLTRLVKDYRETFSGAHGERVLADLSLQCYENAMTYVDANPRGSDLNDGKRYVILHIRRMMNVDLSEI